MSTPFPDQQIGEFIERERRPGALRVVQQIKKRSRTKAMTQSDNLCWRGANRAHASYSWRHDQIWGLLLVKVFNLLHTASVCIHFWDTRKLSVFVVKINCLSSFLCPLKDIDVMYQTTLHMSHKIQGQANISVGIYFNFDTNTK